jgi:hypothetical protein
MTANQRMDLIRQVSNADRRSTRSREELEAVYSSNDFPVRFNDIPFGFDRAERI